MTDFLRDNPVFARMAAQAGFADLGSVQGYVSAAGRFAVLSALLVARWASTEAAAVALASVLLAGAAGLAIWVGTSWVDAGLGLGDALGGALSVVPVALLCLGAALAALGWAPSVVFAVGVSPAAGGFLLLVLSDTFGWPAGVRWLSPFTHMNAVPAEAWNVGGALGMIAVAALLAVIGCRRYARRDLLG